MMDVHLTSDRIYYLSESNIQEYARLTVYAGNGEIVKMNPLVLAAMNSTLMPALPEDYEESCLLTEFATSELESVNQLALTGVVDHSKSAVFQALGIDVNFMFDRKVKQPLECKVQIKVKDEPVEDALRFMDHDDFLEGFNENFMDDAEEEDNDKMDEDDDEDFTLDQFEVKKESKPRGRPRKPSSQKANKVKKESVAGNQCPQNLTAEQQELFDNFQLPKALDEYKQSPLEPKVNNNDENNVNKPLACHLCHSRFTTEPGLQGHLIKYHSEHYNCSYCYRVYPVTDADGFKLHMFKHEQKILLGTATCVQCGIVFKQPTKLKEHIELKGPHHDEECSQCPVKLQSYEDYQKHVNDVHEGKWRYKCGFCKEMFDAKWELRSHCKALHVSRPVNAKKKKDYVPKKKVCNVCGSLVSNLKIHIEGVHGSAHHPCSHCTLVFKTIPSLQRHIEWVHVKMPCTECGEMVGVRKMTRHIEQKHTSIYDRKFKCDVCGKGFSDKSKLSDHKNTHTGEKPFKCKFCTAAFASRGTHAMHQRSHLGHRRSK